MSKKVRMTFNLSAVALLIAIAAQSYTNYQIDQTLKQFPYHFRDQFTLQVDEKNSDFFTRDLTFSIKHQNDNEQIEFIHTKLTTLPFFISAQSDIPQALIKKLNNTLKITIDKNIINSQFSVFGENLQSDIVTQLRDSTNTQQILETDLVYSPKSGIIDIQTNLSGLNYDSDTKIKGLTAKILLSPVGESHYDITKGDLNIANTDISFLNGENTRIEVENLNFSLNKKIDSSGYDLTRNVKNKLIKLSDKNTKSEAEKIRIEAFEISLKQLGVPSHVTFYDQLGELNTKNININQAIKKINNTLFDNELSETRISIKNMQIPEEGKNLFTLKDTVFNFSANNKKKEDSEQNVSINIGEIEFMNKLDLLKIKGINWDYNITQFNLLTYFDFLYKYLPEKLTETEYSENKKESADFLKDLKNLTANYKTQVKSTFKLRNISLPKYFSLDNFVFNITQEPANGDFNSNNYINFDKLSLEKEAVQFSRFNWTLPFKISHAESVYPLYLCSNTYKLLCNNHLSLEDYKKLQAEALEKITLQVNDSVFSTHIDTIPPSKAGELKTNLKLSTLPSQENILRMIQSADINFNLSAPIDLVSDMSASELSETAKIKNKSAFWLELKKFFSPELNPLMELASTENGYYQFNFVQKEHKLWLNGKNIEEFEEEKITRQRLEQEKEQNSAEQQSVASGSEIKEVTFDKSNTTEKDQTEPSATHNENEKEQEDQSTGKK